MGGGGEGEGRLGQEMGSRGDDHLDFEKREGHLKKGVAPSLLVRADRHPTYMIKWCHTGG